MSFKDLKITTYQDSVSALPDYPSDAGITAAQLKAVFDGRTDKEVKEKHNGLVDAVGAKIDEVETNIERRAADVDAQIADIETRKLDKDEFESFGAANETILEGKADREELDGKVDKVSGKGLSSNDFTDERSAAIDDALYEAIYAQAELDRHANDKTNPHKITAAQVGLDKVNNTPDNEKEVAFAISAEMDFFGNVIHERYATKEEVGNVDMSDYVPQEEFNLRVTPIENDINNIYDNIGDIDSALDAILAIQNEFIGGDA